MARSKSGGKAAALQSSFRTTGRAGPLPLRLASRS